MVSGGVNSNMFALRVAGDSMIEAGIHDGDIAVVHQQDTAENGDIVVALLEDEATLKYFYKERKKVRLEPANKAYKPIIAGNVSVVGKLVGIYRNF
jgi:repressor LexA